MENKIQDDEFEEFRFEIVDIYGSPAGKSVEFQVYTNVDIFGVSDQDPITIFTDENGVGTCKVPKPKLVYLKVRPVPKPKLPPSKTFWYKFKQSIKIIWNDIIR